MKTAKKQFKVLEQNAVNVPTKDKEILWEGEEIGVESDTKLEQDKGTGHAVILRFFDFAVNPNSFKQHIPSAQELFNSHLQGIKSLLWRDALAPFNGVQPRLVFSKDKKYYRFIIPCIAGVGNVLIETPQTLSQLTNESRNNSKSIPGKF